MADITMCDGVEGSELCKTCYRKNAKASDWQTMFDAPMKDGECEHYWEDF